MRSVSKTTIRPARRCDVCGFEMYDSGDCRNPECVQSARLPACDEIQSGSYTVEGFFTQRSVDGTLSGSMRVVNVDPDWSRHMLDWAERGKRAKP